VCVCMYTVNITSVVLTDFSFLFIVAFAFIYKQRDVPREGQNFFSIFMIFPH
jgi:hypothetical protein